MTLDIHQKKSYCSVSHSADWRMRPGLAMKGIPPNRDHKGRTVSKNLFGEERQGFVVCGQYKTKCSEGSSKYSGCRQKKCRTNVSYLVRMEIVKIDFGKIRLGRRLTLLRLWIEDTWRNFQKPLQNLYQRFEQALNKKMKDADQENSLKKRLRS